MDMDNFNWPVKVLEEKGLQSDWIFSQCCVLMNDMEHAHEKFGVSQHLVAGMPKISQEIEEQLAAQNRYYEALNTNVQEAADLMLRQEAVIPPEEIEHLVLQRLQLQMEQGDVKAAMAILAYQGHKRLCALEEKQGEQENQISLLQQEQQRLAALMDQVKQAEAENAQLLQEIQQQLAQPSQSSQQRRHNVIPAITQWLQAQPQNTRQKAFWKW
jgi:hypothetical protein